MSACDLYIISDNGGKGGGDASSAADCIDVLYQPDALRFRGTSIGSNTAHRGAQRGPGQNQIAPIIAPILDKAADALGISRLEIRKINAPRNGDVAGPRQTPPHQPTCQSPWTWRHSSSTGKVARPADDSAMAVK